MNSWFCVLSFLCLIGVVANENQSEIKKCGVKIVDLSHEIVRGIPRILLLQDLRRNDSVSPLKGDNNSVMFEDLGIATHFGTHLDAPCHLKTGAWCLDDIPLQRLVLVPVAVIDVRRKIFPPNSSPRREYQITVRDITDWEAKYRQKVPDFGVVLFYTDWQRYWNNSILYTGGDTSETMNFPGLSPEASLWLVKNRSKLYGVGIDTLSIDYGKSQDLLSHNYLCGASMYIMENLMNLNLLPVTGAKINIGVMKLGENATGAPARVLGIYPGSRSSDYC